MGVFLLHFPIRIPNILNKFTSSNCVFNIVKCINKYYIILNLSIYKYPIFFYINAGKSGKQMEIIQYIRVFESESKCVSTITLQDKADTCSLLRLEHIFVCRTLDPREPEA